MQFIASDVNLNMESICDNCKVSINKSQCIIAIIL